MENVIFVLTLGVLSLHFFTASYRITGINRVFYNIPIAIFETSIPLVQSGTSPLVYYDKDMINNKLTSYFEDSVTKYCKSYELEIFYYVQDDYSYCLTNQCDAVEISIDAKVLLNYEYHKTARFYIQDNR